MTSRSSRSGAAKILAKTMSASYSGFSCGKIILSGILVEQAQAIAELYTADFTIDAIVEDGDWASISGTKR